MSLLLLVSFSSRKNVPNYRTNYEFRASASRIYSIYTIVARDRVEFKYFSLLITGSIILEAQV